MRKIDEIIIHCTATKVQQKVTVAIIDRWHRQRGFKSIGYHYFIDIEGKVYEGRPLTSAGAHCKGHNSRSIGIAIAGGIGENGKPQDTRNEAQNAALIDLLKELREQFPEATIHGHREFAAKACPSFDVQQWLSDNNLISKV